MRTAPDYIEIVVTVRGGSLDGQQRTVRIDPGLGVNSKFGLSRYALAEAAVVTDDLFSAVEKLYV